MKLLAKTAEDRYQTAAGLAADLHRCLAEWERDGRIAPFAPGAQDIPDRLRIPEKLYGRERRGRPTAGGVRAGGGAGRPELVLVSGYSGIGKSAVVNELHKALVPPRGLFAAGKFDQSKRDVPYAHLGAGRAKPGPPYPGRERRGDRPLARERWREALGPNGRLMVDLVPELKLVIGEQPPVPELPPQDAQRRFQLVVRRLARRVRAGRASAGAVPRRFAMARRGDAGSAGGSADPVGAAASAVDRRLSRQRGRRRSSAETHPRGDPPSGHASAGHHAGAARA